MHRRLAGNQRAHRHGWEWRDRRGVPRLPPGRAVARRLLLAAVGSLLLAAAAAGCSRSDPTVHIGMYDNFYNRDLTRVPVGATVSFDNEGRISHNALAVNDTWKTPQRVEAGDSFTLTFDRPGTYLFYCSFHATPEGEGMAARLVVGDDQGGYGTVGGATGEEAPRPAVASPSGVTRRVPEQHATIQAAVDAADPGDLILVGPGTYREEVKVRTPSLTLRGTDRNAVIVDGEFKRPNAVSITADGVAVENLTVRNALFNGLFWTGVKGYRSSYVTA